MLSFSIVTPLALYVLVASADAPVNSRVNVDQISRGSATASPIPQPVSSGSREREGGAGLRKPVQSTSQAATQQEIEACRDAGVRGIQLAGVDCQRILQPGTSSAVQLSGEGALLEMFGQRANVTTSEDGRTGRTVNADDVARQLSNGDAQGNAAEVVATIRNNPPPSAPPR